MAITKNQIKLQLLSFFLLTIGLAFDFSTILIAQSKIFFNPCCVKALHSMYLHWNYYSIIFCAVSFIIGAYFGSFFIIAYSSRKSILLPTKIFGTFPTFSCNYGYHYDYKSLYFLSSINKGRRLDNRENNKKNITMWVSQRT